MKLEPERDLKVDVPAMTEITGAVVVACNVEGAHVEAFDDNGELLDKMDVAGGDAKLKIRVGRQNVRVSKYGYRRVEEDVEAKEGAETRIAVELQEELLQVTLAGPPDSGYGK